MKHALILLLALCLTCAALPALAENADPAALAEGEVRSVDLDGDGAAENVRWDMVPGEYDANLTLTVASPEGAETSYATDIIGEGEVFVADLDGDGIAEILISGDVMSDDYITWCLRLREGTLYELLFPDGNRGDSGDGYYKYGYGRVTAVGEGNGLINLTGSQDMLGTWFATRTLALTPYDRFEFNDAGLWLRSLGSGNLDDLWEYASLKLAVPLAYTDLQGNPAGTLQPGDRILVIATDKRESVRFVDPDGNEGVLAISPDYERGWGWLVDGVPEAECFEFVPYAD